MEENKLIEGGAILYVKEHTEELRKKNKLDLAKTILLYIVFAFILFLFWYIKHNNILNNIVAHCG